MSLSSNIAPFELGNLRKPGTAPPRSQDISAFGGLE